MARSFHYVVKGQVQGVCFRQFTKDTAESLGVVGWVKNHKDGSVIGVAEGEEPAVAKFREAINTGPPGAVVDTVEVSKEEERGQLQFAKFDILRR